MPASNMEKLHCRFSDLDCYKAICYLLPTFQFRDECLQIWRELIKKLEQPQKEHLLILYQIGKVNLMVFTIPDEDDTSRSKLFSLPLFANSTTPEKLQKVLSRKKDSTAFDFILYLMTQANVDAHQSVVF